MKEPATPADRGAQAAFDLALLLALSAPVSAPRIAAGPGEAEAPGQMSKGAEEAGSDAAHGGIPGAARPIAAPKPSMAPSATDVAAATSAAPRLETGKDAPPPHAANAHLSTAWVHAAADDAVRALELSALDVGTAAAPGRARGTSEVPAAAPVVSASASASRVETGTPTASRKAAVPHEPSSVAKVHEPRRNARTSGDASRDSDARSAPAGKDLGTLRSGMPPGSSLTAAFAATARAAGAADPIGAPPPSSTTREMRSAGREPSFGTAARSADRVTLEIGGDSAPVSRLSVTLRGQALHATIVSADHATAERLEQNLGDLRRALAERGFSDARLSVREARPDGGTDLRRETRDERGPREDSRGRHPGQTNDSNDSSHQRPRRRSPSSPGRKADES